MKQRIKNFKNKRVRLKWHINGWDYDIVGEIKECWKIRFVFRVNGSMNNRLEYSQAANIEAIK